MALRPVDPRVAEARSMGTPEYSYGGGQVVINGSRWQPIERLVRPWVDVVSVPAAPREPRVPETVKPEAYLEWGDAAEFSSDTFRSDARNVGFRVNDPDDHPPRVRYTFTEEGRTTTDFMVTNQEDPSQYVVMRVARQIGFNGPEGAQFLMRLHPSIPGDQTGSGQTPPAPPPLSQIE